MGRVIPTTADPGHGSVRRRRPPRRPIVELEDGGAFAVAMQQAEEVRRGPSGRGSPRQQVVVMIQVSDDGRRWDDWLEFWSGPWRPGFDQPIPTPTDDTLRDEGQRAGTRYVRWGIRSTI